MPRPQKLQPFFPPLEPLQSLNLRAALYRCLNELKKNGVLGREVVLRKTMLDECKGDRFDEILLVFSTAVLRRVVTAKTRRSRHVPIAKRLATAASPGHEDCASLLPLAIAHRASLAALLRRKDERRARYNELAELVEQKAQDMARRDKQCQAALQSHVEPDLFAVKGRSVQNQLRENWLGNTKWLDVMLHGDNERAEDELFKRSFIDVWDRVREGQSPQSHDAPVGLLEDLEKRVEVQQRRLERWRAFHSELASLRKATAPKTEADDPESKLRKPLFRFDAHQTLRIGCTDVPTSQSLRRPDAPVPHAGTQYRIILASMREEMLQAPRASRRDRSERSASGGADASRDGSGHPDQAVDRPVPEPEPETEPDNAVRVEAAQPAPSGKPTPAGPRASPVPRAGAPERRAAPSTPGPDAATRATSAEPPAGAPPAPSLEERLAARILASVAAAAPSPVRQPGVARPGRPRPRPRPPAAPCTPGDAPTPVVDTRHGSDLTPTERLFSRDAEEGSVFKSRPRVALSPAYAVRAGDGGAGDAWSSSPLGRDGDCGDR